MTEQHNRYISLDVFRGMTICFMIIVNSPGSWDFVYGPLLHAQWHGFMPADLVFPSFLFAVGNAMAFVMYKYEGKPDGFFWSKILKRTFIIFLIGYLMYWLPFVREAAGGGLEFKPLSETRIPGVLQRIAICYCFAAIIIRYRSNKFVWLFSLTALIAYWMMLYFFADQNNPYSLSGNAVLKLDLILFGEDHLYHGEGVAFDPEGFLSTLPAIGNVIGGYLAGNVIRKRGNTFDTITKLFIAGGLLVLLACAWNIAFPINKKLWTSSFVLLTVGLDLLLIAILIYVIELQQLKRWGYFFEIFGRNALFIYLLSEVSLITMYMIPVGDKKSCRMDFCRRLWKLCECLKRIASLCYQFYAA